MPTDDGPILLFDGGCSLCDWSVQFVLAHESRAALRFASLQSDVGRRLTSSCGIDTGALDSLVLVEGAHCYVRSDAALRVARHLDLPWRWLALGRVVPTSIRDRIYDGIARRRYRWFGTREACRLPTPDVRQRFLDADELAPAGGGA